MNQKLLSELREALDRRNKAREIRAEIVGRIAESKAELREADAEIEKLTSTVESIEREVFTGETGLPLVDAARRNGVDPPEPDDDRPGDRGPTDFHGRRQPAPKPTTKVEHLDGQLDLSDDDDPLDQKITDHLAAIEADADVVDGPHARQAEAEAAWKTAWKSGSPLFLTKPASGWTSDRCVNAIMALEGIAGDGKQTVLCQECGAARLDQHKDCGNCGSGFVRYILNGPHVENAAMALVETPAVYPPATDVTEPTVQFDRAETERRKRRDRDARRKEKLSGTMPVLPLPTPTVGPADANGVRNEIPTPSAAATATFREPVVHAATTPADRVPVRERAGKKGRRSADAPT